MQSSPNCFVTHGKVNKIYGINHQFFIITTYFKTNIFAHLDALKHEENCDVFISKLVYYLTE